MNILVIYYSVTGNTKALAENIAAGINEIEGVSSILRNVANVQPDDLINADGIIVGSPVYYGSMSWPLKKMFDGVSPFRKKMKDKIGAAFATSAHHTGGKETTMISIIQAMLICGMIIVGDPYESGGHYGIGSMGKPNEKGINEGKLLGKRVAETALKLHGI